MKENQEKIIKKSLEYISSHLQEDISLKSLSKAMGYSESWLKKAFKRIANLGIHQHILLQRLLKAKELLQNTNLDVTEIAFETGFNSYTHFARIFMKKEKITPTLYRNNSRSTIEQPVSLQTALIKGEKKKWFADDFNEPAMEPLWEIIYGKWEQGNGILKGGGLQEVDISFDQPLPENFRVSFGLRIPAIETSSNPHFNIRVHNREKNQTYCLIQLGTEQNTTSILAHTGGIGQKNEKATLKNDQWMRIELEIKEDEVKTAIDGNTVFNYRDPFAPSYSSKCGISFESWRNTVEIREFIIEDLGFAPAVRSLKQGDNLFNMGLFDRAADFYLRYLKTGVSQEETMETRYKIGCCYLRQGILFQAREWFDKVLPIPSDDFWAENARLTVFEIKCQTEQPEILFSEAHDLCKRDMLKNGVEGIISKNASDRAARGFLENAVAFRKIGCSLHAKKSYSYAASAIVLSETYLSVNRFAQAENLLHEIIENSAYATERALLALSYCYVIQGKFLESEEVLAKTKKISTDQSMLAGCVIYRAFNLRAQEKFIEALDTLQTVRELYSGAESWCSTSLIHSALISCMLQKPDKAEELLKTAERAYKNQSDFSLAARGNIWYVPAFFKCEYRKAADLLLASSKDENGQIARQANQALKAGILFELAFNNIKAEEVWGDLIKRFPPHYCNYYSEPARAFMHGEKDNLEEMPYEALRRSEMFYLAGLLYEKRGNKKRAKELFAMSLKEDPTLRWPAYLARIRLHGA